MKIFQHNKKSFSHLSYPMVSNEVEICAKVSTSNVIALVTSRESLRKALWSFLRLKKCLVFHSGCKMSVMWNSNNVAKPSFNLRKKNFPIKIKLARKLKHYQV